MTELNIWDKFNFLTVVSLPFKPQTLVKNSCRKKYLMKCDCGNVKWYYPWFVVKWYTKSCGCMAKELMQKANTTHWFRSNSVSTRWIYLSWRWIKDRCDNINKHDYHRYWGRWITYDTKRGKFENFFADMWATYEKWLRIDRIDNNWNYCKENCRRATAQQQSRNRRTNIKYKWRCLSEWANKKNMNTSKLRKRVSKHWWVKAIKMV